MHEAAATSSSELSRTGLRRSLSLVDLTAIGLNATVGSGIFLLPDDLFRALGPLSPLAFLLCALGLLPVAFCYADAAARTEATGGPYVYAASAFGSRVGFLVGWMCFSNAVFSFSAVAAAAAAYAERVLPASAAEVGTKVVAALVVIVFGILNYFGAKPGAWAVRAFTFGKFAVLFLLVGVLLPEVELSQAATAQTSGAVGTAGSGGFLAALFMAMFALQGFEVVPVPAGEAKAPREKAPVAVLTTLLAAASLYVVVQFVLVFSYGDLARPSDAPLADAAVALSPALGLVVAIGALISTLGFVSGSALGTPRYLFAMAADRHLPSALAALHPRFRSPHVAVVVTCALALLLVVPFDYRMLIGMSNVAVAVQYGSTCAAVFQSAVREPSVPRRSLRLTMGALGALGSIAVWFAATSEELLFAAGALVVGAVVGFGMRGRNG